MNTYINIANRMKQRREELGLEKKDIVEKIPGRTSSMYAQWESGRTKLHAEDIILLARALECSSDYLLFGKENISEENFKTAKYIMEAGINAEEICSFFSVIKKICQSQGIL